MDLKMNDLILAIDPGPVKSGWLTLYDGKPQNWGWFPNEELLEEVASMYRRFPLAIEDVSHFGPKISVGRDVFETCKWMGRFQQAHGGEATYIKRQKIKIHLTGMATAKDKNIRIALIDRFGGESVAIGGKRCVDCKGRGWRGRGRPPCDSCDATGLETPKGPLYGISGHIWSALAIGLTYLDTMRDLDEG